MAKVEMLMPQMGESIAEATILKWLKNVGDAVKKDEVILEISTDKVDSEIPAPAAGVIAQLLAEPGQTVAVKSLIAVIETDASAAAAAPAPKAAAVEAPKPQAPAPKAAPQVAAPAPSTTAAPQLASQAAPATLRAVPGGAKKVALKDPLADDVSEMGVGVAELRSQIPVQVGDRFYSPLVRNIAAQHGIGPNELALVQGTGAQGRVTKEDLMSFIEYRGVGNTAPAAQPQGKSAKSDMPPPPKLDYDEKGLRVEPFDNMRKKIAEHMVRSKQTSPHVYTVAEVDVTNIAKWREKNQSAFLAREGFKLSFTPFFLEAAVKALIQYPQVNASVENEALILKKNVNLGCAVALGTSGLIVPVIKNADSLTLSGIAKGLNDIATKARNKKLAPDDIQGGTFTVTNPGTFGSIIGYPIISQPQLAIMGVGAIKKRPVVVDDAIAIRDIVYLTLSYDHRVIDGSLGGQFLNFIAKYLESWSLDRPLY